ncbi:hypothetical protein Shyd_72110 [Streptomyces hydrogenans]|uniref:Uncharacterized protein n=1 Tax=Streptomyces hydrogenans TaxID=1873719 RepID=A0ABQ3PLE9_9ACTN|nr:hypothetical protein Shyd_72110 [Streptomyces hydrogenans]
MATGTFRAVTRAGTFRKVTPVVRPPDRWTVAVTRPEGTSTRTGTSRSPSPAGTRPLSTAQAASAMVPCPQAVEKPSLCQKRTPRWAPSSSGGTTNPPYIPAWPRRFLDEEAAQRVQGAGAGGGAGAAGADGGGAPLGDGVAGGGRQAVGDDPEGFAGGVVVGDADPVRSGDVPVFGAHSRNPAGKGSVGSRRYWAVPVIQARPVDGRDDGGPAPDGGLGDQSPGELGPDEGLVDEVGVQGELSAGVQLGHPGAGAGAARGAVEPAGVDGHGVPGAGGVGAGGGEVDVLDARDGRVLGVDGPVVARVDRVHDREPRGDQFLLVGAVEGEAEGVEFDEGVEVAAVGEVVGDGAEAGDLGLEVESDAEGGDVGEGDGAGGAVLDADVDGDEAGRGVEADGGDRFGHRDHAGLDEDGGDADGAVAAHREQAGDLDEEDSVVGVGTGGGLEDGTAHAAWPRGSYMSRVRKESRCSMKCSRFSAMVAPGITPTPPVMTRVGMPSVWESTAW